MPKSLIRYSRKTFFNWAWALEEVLEKQKSTHSLVCKTDFFYSCKSVDRFCCGLIISAVTGCKLLIGLKANVDRLKDSDF